MEVWSWKCVRRGMRAAKGTLKPTGLACGPTQARGGGGSGAPCTVRGVATTCHTRIVGTSTMVLATSGTCATTAVTLQAMAMGHVAPGVGA